MHVMRSPCSHAHPRRGAVVTSKPLFCVLRVALLRNTSLFVIGFVFLRPCQLVSQDPVLFCTSIRENISFGVQSASMAEVIAAAKQANATTSSPNSRRGTRLWLASVVYGCQVRNDSRN